MKTKPVFWPLRFVITTLTPSGEPIVTWVLDQRIRDRYNERAWNKVHNEVQSHLHGLFLRTGCQYRIDTWGYKGTVDAYLQMHNIEIH